MNMSVRTYAGFLRVYLMLCRLSMDDRDATMLLEEDFF